MKFKILKIKVILRFGMQFRFERNNKTVVREPNVTLSSELLLQLMQKILVNLLLPTDLRNCKFYPLQCEDSSSQLKIFPFSCLHRQKIQNYTHGLMSIVKDKAVRMCLA
jgi:hypothetical protein